MESVDTFLCASGRAERMDIVKAANCVLGSRSRAASAFLISVVEWRPVGERDALLGSAGMPFSRLLIYYVCKAIVEVHGVVVQGVKVLCMFLTHCVIARFQDGEGLPEGE